MKSIIPIFIATDLDTTENFYSGILGFETGSKHQDYLIMISDPVELHFSKQSAVDRKTNNCACYIKVTAIETLYEKCRQAGCVHPNGKLKDLPWGKEFAITDPDNNLIKFLQPNP